MTKNDFLNTLYQSLLYLPAKERQEILQDYEEHFAAGIEEGKAEEEICRALGDPKEIAQTCLIRFLRTMVIGLFLPYCWFWILF